MLEIYNSLTQEKAPFKPLEEGKVSMYVCGMTVYDYCHIGHARVMVTFDVITRFLRYAGYDVKYIRNITDVDDKIFNRAAENGEMFSDLTDRFIDAMHEDEKRLGVLPPSEEPRATQCMDQIVSMISVLVEKGIAYQAENGDVYFSIEKFPEYGKLNNRKLDEMLAGARVEVSEEKQSPLDFVLWKSAKEGEASWESPWGNGRPGWHIECSAMSTHCLGNTFDIHGGGPDLKFPHHENEIAQSEAATGEKFVNYWMHAGAVRVNKEKMSKSLGNFFTIREVLEKYPAEVVRYFLISSHYRSQVDYSEESLKDASSALERLYNALRGEEYNQGALVDQYVEKFNSAMNDDFNTPLALSVLFELVKEINRSAKDDSSDRKSLLFTLHQLAGVIGLLQQSPDDFFKAGAGNSGISEEQINQLIQERLNARANKDWAESDRIRDYLKENGVLLDDSKEGTTWKRA